MCEASIYLPFRMATKNEILVVGKIPNMRLKGYYPYGQPKDQLVCLRGKVKAIIKHVRFEPGLPAELIGEWEGKRNVEVTLMHRPYHDSVIFPNRMTVMLTSIKSGVRIDAVDPVKPAGMKLVEGAIKEALALPDPPEGGEPVAPPNPPTPPSEPAPADKPAEPAPEHAAD